MGRSLIRYRRLDRILLGICYGVCTVGNDHETEDQHSRRPLNSVSAEHPLAERELGWNAEREKLCGCDSSPLVSSGDAIDRLKDVLLEMYITYMHV